MSARPTKKTILCAGLILLLTMVVGSVSFWTLRLQDRGQQATPAEPAAIQAPSHADVHVKGVTLRRGSDNGMLCTLSIGEMKVVKKKLAFFRIGGLRQLEVVDLDIHIDVSDSRTQAGNGQADDAEKAGPLNDMLRSFRTSLESMTGGISLSGLEGKHVSLEVNRLGKKLLFLKADTLSLTRKKKVLLKGDALVEMRGQVWRGNQVVIDPETMKMKMGKARQVSLRQLIGKDS